MLLGFAMFGVATAAPATPPPGGSAQKTLVLSMTWCETLTLSVARDGTTWTDRGAVTLEDAPAPARPPVEEPAREPAKPRPPPRVATAAPT